VGGEEIQISAMISFSLWICFSFLNKQQHNNNQATLFLPVVSFTFHNVTPVPNSLILSA
jgi:hypothetical protein